MAPLTSALTRSLAAKLQASGLTGPWIRAFRDCHPRLQDARATTEAGLADQLASQSRALLLHAPIAAARELIGAGWDERLSPVDVESDPHVQVDVEAANRRALALAVACRPALVAVKPAREVYPGCAPS